jgi:hypothetical protein
MINLSATDFQKSSMVSPCGFDARAVSAALVPSGSGGKWTNGVTDHAARGLYPSPILANESGNHH